MQSYQNLKILQNLYRLKALGYTYSDPIKINEQTIATQPKDLASLHDQILTCHLCDFSKSRTQSMPGSGFENAKVMFVDYTVSELEDSTSSYYVGRSGEMLKKMIQNVLKLSLEEVYYTHAIKCKPLRHTHDLSLQWQSCKSYLFTQIELIRPKVIVTLGEESFYALMGEKETFESLRGHIINFKKSHLVPIYHPNFLLRNPNLKKIVYNDLKTIKSCL